MKRLLLILWLTICVAVVAVGYVRLAPSPVPDWHVPLTFSADRTLRSGAMRIRAASPDEFRALDQIIRETPNVTVLAGTLKDGRRTYIARSRVIGFPDYVTVQYEDGLLKIYSRIRFGRSDFGVNAARVDGWLNALQAR